MRVLLFAPLFLLYFVLSDGWLGKVKWLLVSHLTNHVLKFEGITVLVAESFMSGFYETDDSFIKR